MAEKESEVEGLEHMFTNENAEPVHISYSVIESITKTFYRVIGHGGFGTVYLGSLRNDPMVAVKLLHPSQDLSDTQFMAEVKCLTRVKHKNIVRFLGYCAYTHEVVMKVEGIDRMVDIERKRFLCFEYAPNGNLQDYLEEKTHGYQWSIRYKIIKGICQGLHYLHQKRINHLDLKPANVLMGGAQMEPMITDFGISRHNDGTQSTIVTKNAKGTLGYMPPELITEGKISSKSDIFSLGVIMRRLLMGSDDENYTENWHESSNIESRLMKRCIEIARVCTHNDPSERPTISDIICILTETETSIQDIPPVIIIEPRNNPASMLYKNVNIFMAHRPETQEYYRRPEKLPVERPKWKLAFRSTPKLPIITDQRIEDANGKPLELILVDAGDSGDASSAAAVVVPKALEIELVPVLGNFPRGHCWDADDFQKGIVADVEGKPPLLAGQCRLTMWDGRATVNELSFNHDFLKCGCLLRIGVRVIPGSYNGASRILEAMTEAFMVQGRNGGSDDDEVHNNNSNKHHKWQLVFQCQPRIPIHVGRNIRDVIGNPMEVILVDTKTGSPSSVLPKEELDIRVVALDAKLPMRMDWSGDEFQRAIVKQGQGEGEGPLLSGDVSLTMKKHDDGRVAVNELRFTDSHVALLIGACVVPGGGYNNDDRILEGITMAFMVQDSGEMNRKYSRPELEDQVWRLKGISWGGVFHERLSRKNVRIVEDFVSMLAVKPDELRAIMGEGMDDDTWEEITGHARKCALPGHKVYAYSAAHATIYVTSIFDLVKVEFDGMVPLQKLHEVQKRLVQQLMREAYEHRHSLQKVELTWKLAFKSPLRLPIHTGSRITDATGNPLEIILVDARTGSPLQFPMELLEITVAPLLGDFPPYDGKEDWSAEEFEAAIVRPRTRHLDLPLLKSDLVFKKEDGRVTVDELQFTDDSSWVRCRKFRIGAYVVLGGRYDGEFRIVEAMTEAFEVHDLNRKHYPPARSDPVWRLEMIDKDGAFHRELTRNNIDTVQEFHSMLMLKPNELRAIVGDGMTDGMWVWTTSHAMECDPGDKVYAYNGSHGTIYVDSIFRRLLKQIVIDGVECQLPWQPDKAQTMLVRQLLLEAYEHRHNLHEVVDAAMELSYDNTIELEYLLSRAQRYDGDNDDGGNRAQPLVHHDEVTVPQATNLVHHGPSQTESGSDS